MNTLPHNFNKPVHNCCTCGHYNRNAGTFSFCLVQNADVWEGDHCDKHASYAEAKKREQKELQFTDTVFDRGDGLANFQIENTKED